MFVSKDENRRILSDIKRNVSIVDYAARLGKTPVRIGSYYTLRENDSVRIDPVKNIFYRNSNTNADGNSIFDFLIEFQDGINNFHDAAVALGADQHTSKKTFSSCDTMSQKNTVQKQKAGSQDSKLDFKDKKKFVLPERDNTIKNVYAYLIKERCIDKDILAKLVQEGYIRQDKRKNCLFIGYDNPRYPERKPVFASLRGTNTFKTFKGDVSGSDYNKGFYIDNGSKTMCVAESPIDALSMMTFAKINGGNPFDYNYLALSGVGKYKCLFSRLQEKHVDKIIVCLDNDEAGKAAEEKIFKELKDGAYNVEVEKLFLISEEAKDINEDLCLYKKNKEHEQQLNSDNPVTSCHNSLYRDDTVLGKCDTFVTPCHKEDYDMTL